MLLLLSHRLVGVALVHRTCTDLQALGSKTFMCSRVGLRAGQCNLGETGQNLDSTSYNVDRMADERFALLHVHEGILAQYGQDNDAGDAIVHQSHQADERHVEIGVNPDRQLRYHRGKHALPIDR